MVMNFNCKYRIIKRALSQILILLFLVCGYFGVSHYLHEYQSPGNRSGTPGKNYIAGRKISQLTKQELSCQPNENSLQCATRINNLIHFATYHCHPNDFKLSFIEKNLSKIMERRISFYWYEGLWDDRMLCGFCHQRAYILCKILKQNNINASTLGLNGHVVTLVYVDKIPYLLDPDYGVGPIPYNLDGDALETFVYKAYGITHGKIILPMLITKEKHRPYNHPSYFSAIDKSRSYLRNISDFLAFIFIFCGTLGLLRLLTNLIKSVRSRFIKKLDHFWRFGVAEFFLRRVCLK